MLAMKSTTKPKSDYLLQNRSREEAKRNKNIETTQYYAVTANKSSFENNSTLAIKRNHIARKFLELKAKEDENLEIRKEKLRKLFADDEEQYRVALIKKEETKEERIQRMKERMMELKSRREAERKQIVEEKLNQKWRNECNELKEVESKLIDKEVSAAREEQIRELNQRRQKALEEKKYYDTLWEKDRQKKILREETDKANQKALNDDMLRQLGSQLKQLYEQECEEKRLQDEEASLQRKQAELQSIEEKRAQVAKLEAQIEIRADLDRFNKEKIRQRAKEVKESLEMDLSIVNDFFKADEKERELKNRKREEARKEMILYREHLKEMKRVEEEREKELEKLYQDEEEKVWKIRAEKWKKEQKARDKLMMEVLQGRQEQLRLAMEQNQLRLLENKVEQENIKRSIESARVADESEKQKVEEKGEIYRTFLNKQVQDNDKIRAENKKRLASEIQAEKDMHRKFQDLLKQETEKTIARGSHQARILGMVEMNRSSKILKRVNSAVESNHAAGVAAEIGSMFKDNKIQQQQQKSRQLPQLPFVVLATQKASGGNTHSSSEVTANTSYPAIPSTPRLYDILKKKNKKKQALKLEEVPREPSTRELLNRLINRTAMGHYIPPKGEQPLSSLELPTPGPLDYNPQLPPSGIQFSIQGKFSELPDPKIPGPTHYETSDIIFQKPPMFTFGVKLKDEFSIQLSKNDTPSPFAYNNSKTFASEAPASNISGWTPVAGSDNPGPDKYFPPSNLGSNPKWSLGLKLEPPDDPKPGPADYTIVTEKSSFQKAPQFSMRPKVGLPVFTNKEDELIPGANKYYPKMEKSAKAASLKGWYREITMLKTPGPANYIMPNYLFNGPQHTLTPRNVPIEDEPYYIPPPGPADYNPTVKLTHESPPSYSLGRRRPFVFDVLGLENDNEVPGPGAYDPKEHEIVNNEAPKVTLKARHPTKIDQTPGPACYNPVALAVEETSQPKKHYSPSQTVSPPSAQSTNSTGAPQSTAVVIKAPGPADYNIGSPAVTKRAGPVYSLGKVLPKPKPNDIPGPNEYEPIKSLKSKRRGVTLKGRPSPFIHLFPSSRLNTLKI